MSATLPRDLLLFEWFSTTAILRSIRRELEINTSTHNLISATKDELPGITNENVGLNWLCKDDGTCLDFFIVIILPFTDILYVQYIK
jgi:hypothetical protein